MISLIRKGEFHCFIAIVLIVDVLANDIVDIYYWVTKVFKVDIMMSF